MDCCATNDKNTMKEEQEGGKKMDTNRMVMWIVIGILLIATVVLTVKTSSGGASSTGQATSGKIDTTGWTENEIMNYEMHGIVPARAQSSAGASSGPSSQMVGGC